MVAVSNPPVEGFYEDGWRPVWHPGSGLPWSVFGPMIFGGVLLIATGLALIMAPLAKRPMGGGPVTRHGDT